MDKRIDSRKVVKEERNLFLEIALSYPHRAKITKDILDFSESGLAFQMSSDEGFFPVGTPLDDITLKNKSATYKISGIVTDVKNLQEGAESFYRIGVEFNKEQGRTLRQKRSSFFPLRPRRYSGKEIPATVKFISFKDRDGEEYKGEIVDFSKFGAGFVLGEYSSGFRVSQTLQDLKVVIGEEVVFSGSATIVNLRKVDESLLIGVSFESEPIDLDKVFYLDTKSMVEKEMSKTIRSFVISDNIFPAFKAEVADLRYFLEDLKREFEKYESQFLNETTEKRLVLEKAVLEAAAAQAFPTITSHMNKIASIAKDLNPQEDDVHKEYFRHHLHELFITAPFMNRAFKKPFGYAGDYEMMNMLYRDHNEGKTLYDKFMNNHIWQTPSGQAVRNRIPYLLDKIEKVAASAGADKKVFITSVACGPAKEVQDFLNKGAGSDHCEFNLIDSDRKGLLYCQEKLLEIKLLKKRTTKINILHKSVIDILRERNNPFLVKQDLIYSVGLFDYLTTDLSKNLIRIFYEHLNPNGTIIIGNFDPSNETRNYLEYVMEWYLIHRTDQEMLDLASQIPSGGRSLVEKEPAMVNSFLIIKKD